MPHAVERPDACSLTASQECLGKPKAATIWQNEAKKLNLFREPATREFAKPRSAANGPPCYGVSRPSCYTPSAKTQHARTRLTAADYSFDRARANRRPLAAAWPRDWSSRNTGVLFSARCQNRAVGFIDHNSERNLFNAGKRGNAGRHGELQYGAGGALYGGPQPPDQFGQTYNCRLRDEDARIVHWRR
jgi:hypothetical protein